MERRQVNPWTWQDAAGFSQGWRVEGADLIVFVSGQAPISADGQLVGAGDFEAQTRQVFENLRTVLADAGASYESIVKITVYLTDMANLAAVSEIRRRVLPRTIPSTTVQISRLTVAEFLVEIEAIALVPER